MPLLEYTCQKSAVCIGKLVFDITKAPPTLDAIDAQRKVYRTWGHLLLGSLLLLAVSIAMSIFTDLHYMANITLFIILITIIIATVHGRLPIRGLKEIEDPVSLYQGLLETEEGKTYRQAVIEQGRVFVKAEALMVDNWHAEMRERSALEKLYSNAEA